MVGGGDNEGGRDQKNGAWGIAVGRLESRLEKCALRRELVDMESGAKNGK